jgi:isopenicillin N synthase-like dioxygenase
VVEYGIFSARAVRLLGNLLEVEMQVEQHHDDGYGHRIPGGLTNNSVSRAEVPMINFEPFLDGTAAGKRHVASAIKSACIDSGFFYLANHNVSQSTIDQAFAEARTFFALPLAEKMEISQTLTPGYPGFTAMGLDSGDPKARKRQEGFNMNLEVPKEVLVDPVSVSFHNANLWPKHPPGFRPAVEAYFEAMGRLKHQIFSAFAIALDLPETFFEAELTRPFVNMRINHYAAQPKVEHHTDIGGRPHTDYCCFTILAQEDDVAGLQLVQKNGSWAVVPPVRGTFNINIGDTFERWSNNLFASTIHRVVNQNTKSRLSIAYFAGTNFETSVTALPGTVEKGDEPRYSPIAAGRYVLKRLSEAYDPEQIKRT